MVRLSGAEVTLGFNAEGWQWEQQQHASYARSSYTSGSTAAGTAAAAAAVAADADADADAPQQQQQLLRFGWDNEMPARISTVASCEMQHRPVCVLEYIWFMAHELSTTAAVAAVAAVAGDGDNQYAASHADGGSTGADSSRSSSSSRLWVVQQLGPEGLLQGLLPQSLQLTDAMPADAAAPKGHAYGTNGGAMSNSSSSSSSSMSQQQMFWLLQQLLSVKSVYGPVPIATSGLWPIYCSNLQAEAYAAWWDGGSCRLPTEGELLLARQYNADVGRQYSHASGGQCSSSSNSGSGADGGSGRLPSRQYNAGADRQYNYEDGVRHYSSSSSAIRNAAGELAAVDFNVWHPVNVQLLPITLGNQQCLQQLDAGDVSKASRAADLDASPLLSQLADNGWEWSSTVFDSHAGFQPHPLYPEYSVDFFDGKHVVLLGASWATLGGIAGRRSFRNWYQAGQQHVFAKFRLCKSM
jgi:formylglycine-generating enzyme required for sulfatase activity